MGRHTAIDDALYSAARIALAILCAVMLLS
jgi:hypothetical protein